MTAAMQVVETYVYTDESGSPLYEVLRYEPKSFRQRRVDGHGGHTWSLAGVERVPYKLPELRDGIAAGKTIVVVEGEKDVNRLRSIGVCATTNAGGAAWPWTESFAERFRGAPRVAFVPDCDEPGRKAAEARAAVLARIVDDVRIVELDRERHDGYDYSDWVADGNEKAELKARIEQAPRFIAPIAWPHRLDRDRVRNGPGTGSASGRELRVVEASKVRLLRPEWIEAGRIPLAALTILDGSGGIGKTTVALAIIARATVGRTLFDTTRREPMNALVIAEEDDLGVLRAKLAVAAADLHRIRFIDASILGDVAGSVRFPRDVPALRELIASFDAPIVYIDALFSHLELEGDGKMAHQMRESIAPIARLARESGAAALATRHWGKGAKSAADRGLGSVELSNVARSVLSFGKHPDSQGEDQRFVLAATKSNWSMKAPSIEYQLESVEVLDENGSPWSVPRVVIKGVAAGVTADDLAMHAPQDAEERDKLSEAQGVILEALEDGRRSADELEKVAREYDISKTTFDRARAKLRTAGRIVREGGGVAGPVFWSLASATNRHLTAQIVTVQSDDECAEMTISADSPSGEIANGTTAGTAHSTDKAETFDV